MLDATSWHLRGLVEGLDDIGPTRAMRPDRRPSSIDPLYLDRIFDRYHRSPDAIKSGRPGTGPGLPIALSMIEGHGGTIEVWSEPRQGSVFTIRLPAADN